MKIFFKKVVFLITIFLLSPFRDKLNNCCALSNNVLNFSNYVLNLSSYCKLTPIFISLLYFFLYTCNNNTSDCLPLFFDNYKENLTPHILSISRLLSVVIDTFKMLFMAGGNYCGCRVSEVLAAQLGLKTFHSTIYLQVVFFIPKITTSLHSYSGNIFLK